MTVVRLENNEKRLQRLRPDQMEKHRNTVLSVKDTRKIDQMMKCWDLRVRGYSVGKIASHLHLSMATVSRRLLDAKKMLETQMLKLDENQREMLANRLEYVYGEAAEAWEKSKTTAITSLEDGKELIQTNPGDPRFLLTALETLKTQQKLMGLDERQGVQVNVNLNQQIVEGVSHQQRMQDIAKELAVLGMLPAGMTPAITVEAEDVSEDE